MMHLKIEKRQNDGIASEMCSDKKRLFIYNNLQTADKLSNLTKQNIILQAPCWN